MGIVMRFLSDNRSHASRFIRRVAGLHEFDQDGKAAPTATLRQEVLRPASAIRAG